MANELQWNLEGLGPVLAKMEQVKGLPKMKATRFALRKAANVVRDAAQIGASYIDDPSTDENIAKHIVVRNDGQYFRQTGDLKMSVGVNRRGEGKKVFYWSFVELGTEHSRAKPFMRPALSENTDKATSEFLREFEKALTRAIRRANKGN